VTTSGSERPGSLAGISFFRPLDPAHREACERQCGWHRWSRSQHIIDREGHSRDVYFVVSGHVRVVDFHDASHRFVIFDDIGSGGCFGELAAIDGMPRSAHVVAAEETVTASMHGDALLDLVFAHQELGLAFLQRLTEMVRQSDTRIMDISLLHVHDRIYVELLRRAKTGGGRPPNTAIITPVPIHAEIAARVSTTRETVNRVFGELTRLNILRRDGDGLTILDLGRLIGMAHQHRAATAG
jgi:CRP/FNR family transcriptional regulator, cyclic AMP receptor protein